MDNFKVFEYLDTLNSLHINKESLAIAVRFNIRPFIILIL